MTFGGFSRHTSKAKKKRIVGQKKGYTMHARRRSKRNLTERERLADAKKALKQTQSVLKMELRKVDKYVKAIDTHNPFPI